MMRMQLTAGNSEFGSRIFGTHRAMVGLVCLLMMACAATSVQAQFPTPEITKEHKVLKKDVGVWDAETKFWPAGPNGDPMVSKGIERNRMIGGLWLLCNFSGEFGGQEFKGHSQTGYNSQKKKYVGTWVDSMSTHITTMEGTYDETKDELTSIMTSVDPATGNEITSKSVAKYTGKDTRMMTMYMADPNDGDVWVKSMEISYKRRPSEGKNKK